MRPVMYSKTDARCRHQGWKRCGRDISHTMNNYTLPTGNGNYYSLSFTIDFSNPDDTVLIAYTYPYTTKDYHRHIQKLISSPDSKDKIHVRPLCQTLSGSNCDIITITDFTHEKDRIGYFRAVTGTVC